jgi:Uncharacterized protein conserved in bacteria (DUF2188)
MRSVVFSAATGTGRMVSQREGRYYDDADLPTAAAGLGTKRCCSAASSPIIWHQLTRRLGMAKNQHVVPQSGKWAIKGEGSKRASKVVSTQKEAIDVARKIARNQGADVVIHRRDGKILDSYGNDPFPPRDTKH